jgi:predicted amidophosphoribosyltransferase
MLGLLDAIAPPRCAACNAEAGAEGLCARCLQDWPTRMLSIEAADSIYRAFTLGDYSGPVGGVVRRAKYGRREELAAGLAEALFDAVRPLRLQAECVVPVPTTTLRRAWRGFELTEVLADAVARAVDAPVERALRRERAGSQAALDHAARQSAARQTWRAFRPLRGTVILVDDVLTTGATARACADECLGAGARAVMLVVAAARASTSFDDAREIGRALGA